MPVPYRPNNTAGLNPAQWAAIAAYLEQGWDNLLVPTPNDPEPFYTATNPEFLQYRNNQDPCPEGWVTADPAAGSYDPDLAPAAIQAAANWLLAYPGGPAAAGLLPNNGPRPTDMPKGIDDTLTTLRELNGPGGD